MIVVLLAVFSTFRASFPKTVVRVAEFLLCGIAFQTMIITTFWAATFNRTADRRSFSTREWRLRTGKIFTAFWARRWFANVANWIPRSHTARIIQTAVWACRSMT